MNSEMHDLVLEVIREIYSNAAEYTEVPITLIKMPSFFYTAIDQFPTFSYASSHPQSQFQSQPGLCKGTS